MPSTKTSRRLGRLALLTQRPLPRNTAELFQLVDAFTMAEEK
jgi:hypothetical protein